MAADAAVAVVDDAIVAVAHVGHAVAHGVVVGAVDHFHAVVLAGHAVVAAHSLDFHAVALAGHAAVAAVEVAVHVAVDHIFLVLVSVALQSISVRAGSRCSWFAFDCLLIVDANQGIRLRDCLISKIELDVGLACSTALD